MKAPALSGIVLQLVDTNTIIVDDPPWLATFLRLFGITELMGTFLIDTNSKGMAAVVVPDLCHDCLNPGVESEKAGRYVSGWRTTGLLR